MALKMEEGFDAQERNLSLSPDDCHKYGISGSGPYSIKVPCRAFDTMLLYEEHETTFVNYLRICFQWAGFPGLERDNRWPPGMLDFLRKDLLPF